MPKHFIEAATTIVSAISVWSVAIPRCFGGLQLALMLSHSTLANTICVSVGFRSSIQPFLYFIKLISLL